jgi:guanylate kinase
MPPQDHLYHFERPPLLIVISGTSGAGKDSVARALVRRMADSGFPAHFVVTATSRPKRETEVDGIDYIFVTRKAFEQMIENDELIEYALVYDQYKGIPKEQVRKAMESGLDVVMRLDIQGAATIRAMAPEALLIFVTASTEQELAARLRRRHTESADQIEIRLDTARHEMERIPEFDYVVPNRDGQLGDTIDAVMAVVIAEKHRTRPRHARL